MAADWHNSSERPAGSPLSGEVAARVEAIVHAAEREAQSAERAIAERRRAAEEEIQRYLAASRLHADAEAAARAARLESLSGATRRLADELADAATALTRELHRADEQLAAAVPGPPWPAQPAAPTPAPAAAPAESAPPAPAAEPAPEPSWARQDPAAPPTSPPSPLATSTPAEPGAEVPSAARLVAIEMAVGGSSRAEVERELREGHRIDDPQELLDDVFGPASHAGSTLAWGQPEPLS
jgi:hypothetical protein